MPISGSFVRADWSGRFTSFRGILNDSIGLPYLVTSSLGSLNDNVGLPYTNTQSMVRNRGNAEPGSTGFIQGIAFGAPTTIDGGGSFGRNMQVGLSKELVEGNPATPSMALKYPGMWRFRWVVKSRARSITILTKQNSTGSMRPSMTVKANSNIGINFDLSASAADGAGWITMGPISFAASGSDVLWVELRNNNYGVANVNAELVAAPAYFDHIVVT